MYAEQGLAFTLEERQVLGIHGLQPARFKTQEEQLELCQISINRYHEDLNKYLYLVDLQVSDYKLHALVTQFTFFFYFCCSRIVTKDCSTDLSPKMSNL